MPTFFLSATRRDWCAWSVRRFGLLVWTAGTVKKIKSWFSFFVTDHTYTLLFFLSPLLSPLTRCITLSLLHGETISSPEKRKSRRANFFCNEERENMRNLFRGEGLKIWPLLCDYIGHTKGRNILHFVSVAQRYDVEKFNFPLLMFKIEIG